MPKRRDEIHIDDLRATIHHVFNPEPDYDNEGECLLREWPHQRLELVHKLDTSYMRTTTWEGATNHHHTRYAVHEDEKLVALMRNLDVAMRLFESGLYVLADSIVRYHHETERKGPLRYYPPAIMAFWSGFEAFVRYASELMVLTVKDVPKAVSDFLLEEQDYLDEKKLISKTKTNYKPTTKRYEVLLRYGYGLTIDRGGIWWQRLEKANDLRDYYTHLDITEPRSISCKEVIDFMESVLLALIVPSCELKRTTMLNIYWMYGIWATLEEVYVEYTEQPFLIDSNMSRVGLFHCNFENVDESKFPNHKLGRYREES